MKRIPAMNMLCLFMVSSLVFIWPLRAQVPIPDQAQVPDLRTQLALTSLTYQVTVGDVYTLSYDDVVDVITVDYSYRLSFPGLGVFSGGDKTYQQLKREIETIVTYKYPQTRVQFMLTIPSSFSVYIRGEVSSAAEHTTWALERLSSLIRGSLSKYSSIRNITVTATDGQVKTYDLFKAQRFGDLSQDPYLRPGDIITVGQLNRKVSVYGEVKRPGSYELLPGEHIRELIGNYADGFTSRAETGRVELTRYVENSQDIGDMIYLTQEDINANFPLQDFDAIYVLIKS
jgi:protein involved in polysaccharide export with SLBB domain